MTRNQQQMLAKLRDIDIVIRRDKEIPAQVLFSEPVVLLDARGQFLPFHLETVISANVRIHLYSNLTSRSVA